MESRGSGEERTSPTLVDLFCGAGGLSLGLARSGIRPIYGVDHFPAAVKTYSSNIDRHAVCEEIGECSELPPATIYAGGPPCQGFSSAGLRTRPQISY